MENPVRHKALGKLLRTLDFFLSKHILILNKISSDLVLVIGGILSPLVHISSMLSRSSAKLVYDSEEAKDESSKDFNFCKLS